MLLKEQICTELKKCGRTLSVEAYPSLDSTNNAAKNASDISEHGSVIVAESQSSGRGTRGRTFFSPSGGVYMSVILHRERLVCDTTLMTHAAAVAVCRALQRTAGIEAQIKWINDIFYKDRKVCGILTESVKGASRIIVGIGVNVGACDFPDEISQIAGSIGEVDRAQLAAAIIDELLTITESKEDIVLAYSERMLLLGREILYAKQEKTYAGRVLRIDKDGALVILQDDREVRLLGGDVSIEK